MLKIKKGKITKKLLRKLKPKREVQNLKSKKKLVEELDKVFSIFIRCRDKRCYTCGSIEKLQCGHYMSRRHYSTRWDENNCYAQCMRCNVLLHGNYPVFARKLIEEKGINFVKNLELKSTMITKYSCFELQNLINFYAKYTKNNK